MGIVAKVRKETDVDALVAATNTVASYALKWRERNNDQLCEIREDSFYLRRLHRGKRSDVYLFESDKLRCCLKWFHDERWFSRIKNQLGLGRANAAYNKGLKLEHLSISSPRILGLVRPGFLGHAALAMEMVDGFRQMNLVMREWVKEVDNLCLDPSYIQLAEQFGAFTAHLHAEGVLHQDFSPRNVLIKPSSEGFDFCLIDLEDIHFSGTPEGDVQHFKNRLDRYVPAAAQATFIQYFDNFYYSHQPLKIVVTRLQNIGDMLVFIPALRALRVAFPKAKISLLAKHLPGVEIVKNCPYIDDMIIVKGRGLKEKVRLIREFQRRKLDYFIISPQDLGRVPWALMGRTKKIVAYPKVYNYSTWKKEKLPSCIHLPLTYDREKTEVENCVALVAAVVRDVGGVWNTPDLSLEYSWIGDDDRFAAADILDSLGLEDGQYVVSAPYSKRDAKNWPEDRFIDLFNRIHDKWDYPIILIGGKAELQKIESLKKGLGEWVHVLAGKTNLGESSELIKRASFMVGPDSGPAFIGTAVGLPVVAFYGPADFNRWVPPVSVAPRINIFHERDCNPCRFQICPKDVSCMDEIMLDEVWNAVEEICRPVQH